MRHGLVTMLVTGAALVGCGSEDGGDGASGASDKAASGAGVKTVAIGGDADPGSLAVGDGALWIGVDGKLLEADPVSGEVRRRIAVPVKGTPQYMAVDDETVWLVIFTKAKERLVGIDVKSGKVRGKPFAIPFEFPLQIVTARGFVWMASNLKGQGNLYRFDPKVGRFTKRIPGTGNRGLAGDADALWVTSEEELVKVDPAKARVAGKATTARGTGYVGVGDGVVWTGTFRGEIERHDPVSGAPLGESTKVARLADEVVSGPLGSWISDTADEKIVRLDPKTGEVAETIEDVYTQELAVGEKAIYGIGNGDEPSIYVITPGS
jgi:streptogramin lyase